MSRLMNALRRLWGAWLAPSPPPTFERLLDEALRPDRVTLRVGALERELAGGRASRGSN